MIKSINLPSSLHHRGKFEELCVIYIKRFSSGMVSSRCGFRGRTELIVKLKSESEGAPKRRKATRGHFPFRGVFPTIDHASVAKDGE